MTNRFFPTRALGAIRVFICTLTVVAILAADARCDTLYFADIFNPDPTYGSIKQIGDDGKGLAPILDTGGGLRAIALDLVAGKMYWVDSDAPAIRRANLDGTSVETIVTTNLSFPSAIAVDPAGGKIYWGDQLLNQLRRANLDGSGQQLLRSTAFHRGIALDLVNGKIYWSTSETLYKGEILRCNLNGTTLDTIVTSFDPEFKPSAIALDLVAGKMYWTDYVVDVVRWANLDGTNIQSLYVVGANLNPRGIVVNHAANKVYFGQDTDFELPIGSIIQMSLDGAAPEPLLEGAGLVNYLAMVPDAPACPVDVAPPGGDGAVDVADLVAVTGTWGDCPSPPTPCPTDTNGNGAVGIDDLVAVILAWGECP